MLVIYNLCITAKAAVYCVTLIIAPYWLCVCLSKINSSKAHKYMYNIHVHSNNNHMMMQSEIELVMP